jgi:hypothetical protein
MKKEVNDIINKAVLNGKLPIAFFNSEIVKKENTSINKQSRGKVNEKYLQKKLPEADSPILISKIYELF